MNLVSDPWIPVLTRSGRRTTIAPWQVTDATLGRDGEPDPVARVDWARPDLRIGQLELLIGLFDVALDAARDVVWRRLLSDPPTPEECHRALEPLVPAFEIDEWGGARFMQDPSPVEGARTAPIRNLFIDAPGENAEEKNTGFFNRASSGTVLSPEGAAIVLYTHQAFGGAAGQGYRVGLRGGGPLTTLVVPEGGSSLWETIWMNCGSKRGVHDPDFDVAGALPWVRGVVSSRGDVKVRGSHPAIAYFAMPKRIRILFEDNVERLECSLTGRVPTRVAKTFETTNYGEVYADLSHPLTPTYRPKLDAGWLPLHPQPRGLAYDDWFSYVLKSEDQSALARPAPCVAKAASRLADDERRTSVLMAGYDMDNAKARSFHEVVMPAILRVGDERDDLERVAQYCVSGALAVAKTMRFAILKVRGRDSAGRDTDDAHAEFMRTTTPGFFAALNEALEGRAADPGGGSMQAVPAAFLKDVLAPTARRIFDRFAPVETIVADGQLARIRACASASKALGQALAGHGRDGAEIRGALGLAPLEPKVAGKSKGGAP